MRLLEYVAGLKPHDASIAAALLELVRRAGDDGVRDRGDAVAAIRSEFVARGDGDTTAPMATAVAAGPEDADRYFEEHVLTRLVADQVVVAEPEGEAWERARVSAEYWSDVEAGQKSAVESQLEQAVGNLLNAGVRPGAGDRGAEVLAGGSQLSARGLVKIYRRRRVVADVNVQVAQGEIVGLLGPNGAGKTTTFYMMVGLI